MKKKLTKADWKIPALLLALSIVPTLGGVARFMSMSGDAPVTPDNARFLAAPAPIIIHVISATLYCLLGAFQFSPGFRLRWPGFHRRAGRVLALCGLLAGVTGLWMTAFYPIPTGLQGPILQVVRLVVASAMVASIVIAWSSILRREVPRHEAFMIRAYALAQGAGTQVLVLGPWMLITGESGGSTRDLLMTLAWAINIVVAEMIIRARKRQPRKTAPRGEPRLRALGPRQPGLTVRSLRRKAMLGAPVSIGGTESMHPARGVANLVFALFFPAALAAEGCADLREDPLGGGVEAPRPGSDGRVLDGGGAVDLGEGDAGMGGSCLPGQFRCGSSCQACCQDADCPAAPNAEAACGADRVCSYRCRAGSERCRGSCQETSRMIGVCLAAAGAVSDEVHWCDPDDVDERLLKWKFSERQAVELGYDPNDPSVLDKICLGASNGMLGTYCSSGRFAGGRVARMDVVFVYSGRLDGEGKLAGYERTPGSQSRTCRP